jgi:hypothetical protein
VFLLRPYRQMSESIAVRPRPSPSKSFPIHHSSSYHRTLDGLDTGIPLQRNLPPRLLKFTFNCLILVSYLAQSYML